MKSSHKPLTFAAMLIRAQRRFEAMGRPFPSTLMQQGRAILKAGVASPSKDPARLLSTAT